MRLGDESLTAAYADIAPSLETPAAAYTKVARVTHCNTLCSILTDAFGQTCTCAMAFAAGCPTRYPSNNALK